MSRITKKQLQESHNKLLNQFASLVRELKVNNVIDDSVCSTFTKKTEPKQLDRSVFNGMDEKWRFAAVDLDGESWVYREQPKIDKGDDRWSASNTPPNSIGTGYDASNWQNSLIERESKELLEVDLSSELTGSDLALELLKNQRYIIASVSDVSDADAIECGNNKLIHKSSEDIFTDDMGGIYCWAVALNNQGEPLTAREVGL